MKLTLQDDQGELYDVEYAEGADLAHVKRVAEQEAGRPLKEYEKAKEDDGKTTERFLDIEKTSHAATRSELERLRAQVDALSAERDRLAGELASEKGAAHKLTLGKLDAAANARSESAKLYAAEQSLAHERAARAKAEAKAAELAAQLKAELEKPVTKWETLVIDFRRGENGLIRSPLKVTRE